MLSYENPGFSYIPDFRVSTNMFLLHVLIPPVYGTHVGVLIFKHIPGNRRPICLIFSKIEGLYAYIVEMLVGGA